MRRRIDTKEVLQQPATATAPSAPKESHKPPAAATVVASKPASMFDDEENAAAAIVAGFADSMNAQFAGGVKDARRADEEAAREEAKAKLTTSAATHHIKAHPVEGTGSSITVTMGRELFSPVQYNSFEVGPISMTTCIERGETLAQAYTRLRADLTVVFQTEFDIKTAEFLNRMKAAKGGR